MHLPLLKALVAVISACVLAIGVALAPGAGAAHRPHRSAPAAARPASQTTSLEADGLQFLGQLAAGNVTPDPALKQSWTGDVTAVAHSLGLTDRALAQQLAAGRSLAQIAASRGVPTSTPASVLLGPFRADLARAKRDHNMSPAAASALLGALRTWLGKS